MQNNQGTSIIAQANEIVTNHLAKTFLDEVDHYQTISDVGEQHIVIHEKQLACVIDSTYDNTSESLIEKFCYLFTNKTDILVDVTCIDEDVEVPYLKLTLQSGKLYYMQDFSLNYFKI